MFLSPFWMPILCLSLLFSPWITKILGYLYHIFQNFNFLDLLNCFVNIQTLLHQITCNCVQFSSSIAYHQSFWWVPSMRWPSSGCLAEQRCNYPESRPGVWMCTRSCPPRWYSEFPWVADSRRSFLIPHLKGEQITDCEIDI